jgi:hypothetical protein
MDADSLACPYCKIYWWGKCLVRCDKCPMDLNGNICTNKDSTYNQVLLVSGKNITDDDTPWHEELAELIEQYNYELEEKKS